MKQLLFVLLISSWSSPLLAQLRLGIQGGLNMTRFLPVNKRESSLSESYKTYWYRGGQIGIVSEYRISKVISIRTGLLVNGKGTVMKSENMFDTSKRDIELHYLELPIVFTYKKKISATSLVLAGAGLYLARAVRGVETGQGNSFYGPFYIGDKIIFANEN
ncbi:MAG: outer membrane beta-barrel protein, partial [Flavisolibacter sp.]